METATDTPQTEVNDTPQSEAVNTPINEGEHPNNSAPAFDPAKIDPRAKEHFEKEYTTKYADYEPSKKAAQELNQIKNDPRFQKWVAGLNTPEPPKPFEITDEQFTAGLTDRAQFVKLVQDAARHLVDNQIGPKLQQTEQHFQLEAKTNELNATIVKFPDFKELDKRGLIEPILRKYPSISFDEAYKLAKYDDRTADIAKAARGQVAERKGASVERGNNAQTKTKSVVKVEDRLEAMTRTAEDIAAGREPAEYEY